MMKTAVLLLCLVGLSVALQPESDHDREVRSLFSDSDEGWPFSPLLNQLNPDQIRQLLQNLLSVLGPAPAPPSAAPPSAAPPSAAPPTPVPTGR